MQRLTVQAQITVLAGLLGLLLVAGTVGMVAYLATHREIQVAETDMQSLARDVGKALDRGMFERYREIRLIADMDLLRNDWRANPTNARSVLNALQRSLPDYAWIGFARPDGTIHAATGMLLEGQSVAQRPWFVAGVKAPFVGDVHDAKLLAGLLRPRTDSEPFRFVDVAAPVHDLSGNLLGVLGAHLSWDWADHLRRSLLSPELAARGTEIWVLARDGSVLLGPEFGVSPFPASRIAEMKAAGDGAFRDAGSGEDVFTGYAVSSGYADYSGLGWIVLARQPASYAAAIAQGRVVKVALLGVVIAIFGLMLSAMLGGELGRPMKRLTRAAQLIGRESGQTMFPRVTGSHEVTELSGALRSLLRRIGEAERRMAESEGRLEEEGRQHREDVSQLRLLADTDPLSGLMNRRGFERTASDTMELFHRYGRSFAILVLDIDFFKTINDTFGHAAGDEVIQHVANILGNEVRTPDRVARVGGEEFVMLLHEVGVGGMEAVAERVRSAIASAYVCRDAAVIKVTVSIGGSGAMAGDRDIEDVVSRADQALYDAKRAGRNRVVLQLRTAAAGEARAA